MTLVVLAIFVTPGLFKKSADKQKTDREVHNERIIGDAGYEEEKKTVKASVSVSEEESVPEEDIEPVFEEEEPIEEEDDYSVKEEEPVVVEVKEEADEDPSVRYYMFTVKNVDPYLNIRETDSMKADVIGRLKNEKRGYVIEQGPVWTKIATENLKTIGYCYNEFLELEEIEKKDYPKELLKKDSE